MEFPLIMPKQAGQAIKLSSLVKPQRVLIVRETIDKTALIKRLIGLISGDFPELDAEEIFQKVLQREHGISTTLDTGLSIPHARIETDDIIVALALLPEGMPDPAQPGVAIKAVFLFLSPSDSRFFQKHLQLLSSLSALFQPAFIDKLLACETPEDVAREIASHK